ncbi:hypothetical protein HER18_08105 [Chryseobacterium sp. NEB161]|nr:hypothetical protein HER18_08105 [Chryseobacterium sp. NEB161]
MQQKAGKQQPIYGKAITSSDNQICQPVAVDDKKICTDTGWTALLYKDL